MTNIDKAKSSKKDDVQELPEKSLHELNQEAARFDRERADYKLETVKQCLAIIEQREGQEVAAHAGNYLGDLLIGKAMSGYRPKSLRALVK